MGKNKWEWGKFNQLSSFQDIVDYLEGREYTHSNYFHYTRLETAKKIISNGEVWLSNVSGINDEHDKEQFGDTEEQRQYFVFCFSTGVNENLPMWYLYAGLEGKGVRLEVKPTYIKNILSRGTFDLFETGEGEKRGNSLMSLQRDVNMDLSFYDVLYSKRSSSGNDYDLKYNTLSNYNKINADEMNKYKDQRRGFSKDIVWYYEKETRLLIRLHDDVLKLMKAGKKYVVVWKPGDDFIDNMRIMMGPDVDERELVETIAGEPVLIKHLLKTKRITNSEYAGLVHLSPCVRCEYKKRKGMN